MAFKIGREQFLHSLESVQPGVSQREILEQSSLFALSKGDVFTFNDETACRTSSGLPNSFEGAVPHKPLLEVLRKFPDDDIHVDVTDSEILITGKSDKAGIRLEKEITLPIQHVEKPEKWVKLHEDFADGIGIVQNCASTDQTAFDLSCVHIHPKWLEACDNFQLCRWEMKTGVKQATLVRQSAIKHITSLGMTELSETATWLHFRNPNGLILSCRRYVEEYQDLTKILDVEGISVQLPKGLADACDKASIFTAENVDSNRVMVSLKPGTLTLRGQGVSGWYEKPPRKIAYDGEPMSFLCSPKLLSELVKKHNECTLSSNRLKVSVGSYVYIACLEVPVDPKKAVEEEVAKPLKSKKKKTGVDDSGEEETKVGRNNRKKTSKRKQDEEE